MSATGLSTIANWQDDATGSFITSTTLPTAADSIHSNGFVVQLDVASLTVNYISNQAESGIAAGGRFELPNAITLAANNQFCATIASSTIGILNVTATNATLNIAIANSIAHSGTNGMAFSVNGANNNINYIGNITAGGSSSSFAVRLLAATTFNHNGVITSTGIVGLLITAACTLNLSGTYTAGTADCISSGATGSTINGNGFFNGSASGRVFSGTAGTLTISGVVTNLSGFNAIDWRGTFYVHQTIATSWVFQTPIATNTTLFAIANSNVRSGIGTGTLIVPNPSLVVSGVATDNTVGTYSTTPALIATEIFTKLLSNSDFNTAGSFGKLIKDNVDAKSSEIKAKTDLIPTNPASVQSVGAIVASYNV
jgi:hypothetical protein